MQLCQCLFLLSPSAKLKVFKSCILRLCSTAPLSPSVVNIIRQTLPADANVSALAETILLKKEPFRCYVSALALQLPHFAEPELHVYGNYINNHLRSVRNEILTEEERRVVIRDNTLLVSLWLNVAGARQKCTKKQFALGKGGKKYCVNQIRTTHICPFTQRKEKPTEAVYSAAFWHTNWRRGKWIILSYLRRFTNIVPNLWKLLIFQSVFRQIAAEYFWY